MRRICLYSDDSHAASGARLFHFVVAGIAVDTDKITIRRGLEEAEDASGKGTADWHSTKDLVTRLRYLDAVFAISPLTGRVFYKAWDRLAPKQFGNARIDALAGAIQRYGNHPCRFETTPEGLKSRPRHELRQELVKRGIRRVQVLTGDMNDKPEIRLADALAGYMRQMSFGGNAAPGLLPEVPVWFIPL